MRHEGADPFRKRIFDDGPISLRPRGAFLISAGITIDIDDERTLIHGHLLSEYSGLFGKDVAGFGCGGIRLDDDFVQHMCNVFDFLDE